jgi:hypothetical protein
VPITTNANLRPSALVRVGDDLVMPERVTVIAYDMDNGPDVEIEVIPERGRLVAEEIRLRRGKDGAPITTESIRLVQVAHLVQWAAQHVLRLEKLPTEDDSSSATSMVPAGVTDADVEYVREHGLTDRTLQIVAHAYRMGMLMGHSPTKRVEEWLEQPRSTVGRWIAEARKRGYLGASEGPGRSGEDRSADTSSAPRDKR